MGRRQGWEPPRGKAGAATEHALRPLPLYALDPLTGRLPACLPSGVITCYDGFAAPKSACPDLPFYGLLKKSGTLFDPVTGRPVNPVTGFPTQAAKKSG